MFYSRYNLYALLEHLYINAFVIYDYNNQRLSFHSVTKGWTTYGAYVDRSICSAVTWILNNG